jgi:hypothetical protein
VSALLQFSSPTAVQETPVRDPAITLFPNPAHDQLYIRGAGLTEHTRLFVTDVSGRRLTVPVHHISAGEFSMDMHALKSGCYFLHAVSDDRRQVVAFTKE